MRPLRSESSFIVDESGLNRWPFEAAWKRGFLSWLRILALRPGLIPCSFAAARWLSETHRLDRWVRSPLHCKLLYSFDFHALDGIPRGFLSRRQERIDGLSCRTRRRCALSLPVECERQLCELRLLSPQSENDEASAERSYSTSALGSQLPLSMPRSDARQNLIDSISCATSGPLGVSPP